MAPIQKFDEYCDMNSLIQNNENIYKQSANLMNYPIYDLLIDIKIEFPSSIYSPYNSLSFILLDKNIPMRKKESRYRMNI